MGVTGLIRMAKGRFDSTARTGMVNAPLNHVMTAASRHSGQLLRSMWIVAGVQIAPAQQSDSLQQQLEQLKKQYDETTRALEQRQVAFQAPGADAKYRLGNQAAPCATAAAMLVSTSMLAGGHTAMWTILAVGLFNSIMFPTIFSLGVAELGPLTGSGSGILNMAIVGGAILPVIQGAIADHFGIHHGFWIPVICYLYIVFFALSGSKPNSERLATA